MNNDNTITANGTATALSYIYLLHNQTLCDGGDYLLNGNMDGTQDDHTAYFYIFDNTTQSMIGFLYGSEDMDFSYVEGHSLTAGIEIPQGKTITNFTFKPMIRDARIKDPTYVPYAMTNRELTEKIEKIKTGVYNGSLNDLTYTFMGFGYNVTGAATGYYGFIINIAEKIEGSIKINQQWCQNDQTTWHTRNSGDGGVNWSAWS